MRSRLRCRKKLILAIAIAVSAAGPAVTAHHVSAGKPTPATTTTISTVATTTSTTTEVSPTTTTQAAPTTTTTTIDGAGTAIVFTDRYRAFIELFPSGWAPNACEAEVALSGVPGVCTAEFAPVTMYPDGTLGLWPWHADPTSPTGWSIDDPCTDPNVVEYDVWAVYVDWFNYGIYDDPGLTDEQIAASGACWGWWW